MLLLAVLYLFLAAIMLAVRRDIRQTGTPESAVVARLTVVEAGDTSLAAGTVIQLQPVTRIGRSGHNGVVLDDAFVSSEHATITRRDGRWWLADRQSTNGTYLNDQPVRDEISVANGDVIGIGKIRLRIGA